MMTLRNLFGIAIFVTINFLPIYSFAAEREVGLSYEESFKAVSRAMAIQGIKISENNLNLGIIQGEGSFEKKSPYFNCFKGRGVSELSTYNVSVMIKEKEESKSYISIKSEGILNSYRYRHFLFFRTGRVYNKTICDSNGSLENILFQEIEKNL